jgi:hypothetical protein
MPRERADVRTSQGGPHCQDGVPLSEVFDDVVAYVVQDLVGVPLDPVQQTVDTVGTRTPGFLRQRPAVLPLQRRHSASSVLPFWLGLVALSNHDGHRGQRGHRQAGGRHRNISESQGEDHHRDAMITVTVRRVISCSKVTLGGALVSVGCLAIYPTTSRVRRARA